MHVAWSKLALFADEFLAIEQEKTMPQELPSSSHAACGQAPLKAP
jgi:hypothetical protein